MLFRYFIKAFEGKHIWKKIKLKYNIRPDQYLVILTGEQELKDNVLEYLPMFLEKKYSTKAIVVDSYKHKRVGNVEFEYLGPNKIEALLQYYKLENFFDRLIVASLEWPIGSDGLLNMEGVQIADIVRNYLLV